MKLFISPILTPIELIGKFTKPFALAIRLFANMTAGHVVVLALISLIFTFGSWLLAPVPILMALAHHASRSVRRISAGVRLRASVQCVHWTDPRGCALTRRQAHLRVGIRPSGLEKSVGANAPLTDSDGEIASMTYHDC